MVGQNKLKFAVIMCTYKRIALIPYTLKLLNQQSDTDFDLIIWNNNQEVKDFSSIYGQTDYNYNIKVINYQQNIGGIGRFYAANQHTDQYDYFIFIDDDQQFDQKLVETFKQEAAEKTVTGWWAWKILDNYHTRVPLQLQEDGDYIGTGGMVVPSGVFREEELFKLIPTKYLFIEDLWLSYYVKHKLGFLLRKSKVRIEFIPGESKNDQHRNLKELKKEFYNYLTTIEANSIFINK